MPGTDEVIYICLECCFENEVKKGRVLRDKLRSLVPLYRLTRRCRTLSRALSLADDPLYDTAGDDLRNGRRVVDHLNVSTAALILVLLEGVHAYTRPRCTAGNPLAENDLQGEH